MTFRRFAFLGFVAFTWPGAAEELDGTERTLDDVVRVKYIHNSDLPDSAAFISVVGLLSSVDREIALLILQTEMEVDSAASTRILAYLLEARKGLTADIEAAQLNIGCSAGVPRVYDEGVYAVLEDMDDTDQAIGRVHLAKLLEDIGPEMSEKLMRWIRRAKTDIGYVKFDQKKLHDRTGYTGDTTLSSLCNSLSSDQQNK
jgi:hypothetical protein